MCAPLGLQWDAWRANASVRIIEQEGRGARGVCDCGTTMPGLTVYNYSMEQGSSRPGAQSQPAGLSPLSVHRLPAA